MEAGWRDSSKRESLARTEPGRDHGTAEPGSAPGTAKTEGKMPEMEAYHSKIVETAIPAGEGIIHLLNRPRKEAACVFANETMAQITGYSREELARLSWFDLLHPSYREAGLFHYRRCLQGGQVRALSEGSFGKRRERRFQ